MNRHDSRKQKIIDRIKQSALELFTTYGVSKVSMDEIADKANVSKVTIYKYFHNKEGLHKEVINLFADEILAATQKILESDLSMIEKLKTIMLSQMNSLKVADSQALFTFLDEDAQSTAGEAGSLQTRIKAIIYRFYEQGVQEGDIDKNLSFELLYLYSEIFQAGFRAKLADSKTMLDDPQVFEQLLHLYFFGIIQKR